MEYCCEINSINSYLDFLREYRKNNEEEIWFRGQVNNLWKLEPNLYRAKKRKSLGKPGEIERLRYEIPDFHTEFNKFIEKIKSKNLFNIANLNKFQIMFLAQHYGLLTPVLDWTTDPLAALFFALDGYKNKNEIYPVIYLFNPAFCIKNSSIVKSSGDNFDKPLCIDGNDMDYYFDSWLKDLNSSDNPSNILPISMCSNIEYSFRISRQSGNFTLHGPVQPLNYDWNDITIKGKRLVDSIRISPKAVKELKECLELFNVNKKTLYKKDSPLLDKVSKDIRKEIQKDFEVIKK